MTQNLEFDTLIKGAASSNDSKEFTDRKKKNRIADRKILIYCFISFLYFFA